MAKKRVRSPAHWNLGALLMLAHAFTYRITRRHIASPMSCSTGLVPYCSRTRRQVKDVVTLLAEAPHVDEQVLLGAMGGQWHLSELVAAALHPLMKIETVEEARKALNGSRHGRSPFRCVDTGRGGYRALEDVTGVDASGWARILSPYSRQRDLSKVFLLLVEACLVASRSKSRRCRAHLVRQARGLPPSDPYRLSVEVGSATGSGSRWCVLAFNLLAPLNINGLKVALRGQRGLERTLACNIMPLLATRELRIRKPRAAKGPVRCMSLMNFHAWQRSHGRVEPWVVPPAGPRFCKVEPFLERSDFDDSKAYQEGPIKNRPV